MPNDKSYTICACGHPASEHDTVGCEHKNFVISLGLHIACQCMVKSKTLAEQGELRLAELEKLVAKLEEMEGIIPFEKIVHE